MQIVVPGTFAKHLPGPFSFGNWILISSEGVLVYHNQRETVPLRGAIERDFKLTILSA
jgi:hypothetical protein